MEDPNKSQVPTYSPPTPEPRSRPNTVPYVDPLVEPHVQSSFPQEFVNSVRTPVVAPPKKRKKRILIVLGVILLLVIAGGVAAYNLWYQNPEKVVTDALLNATKSKSVVYKGVVSLNSGNDRNVKIEFDGSGEGVNNSLNVKTMFNLEDEAMVVLSGNIVDTNEGTFLKANDLAKVVGEYRDIGLSATSQDLLNKLVAKVDGKWVKASGDSTEALTVVRLAKQKCMAETVKRSINDTTFSAELQGLYKKHKFIQIEELPSQGGNLGYSLSMDRSIAKDFAVDLKKAKLYRSLQECDPDFSIDEHEFSGENNTDKRSIRMEVWIDRWKHEIRKLNSTMTSNNGKASFTIEPTFDQKTDIVTPDASVTVEELSKDISEFVKSIFFLQLDETTIGTDLLRET